MNQAPIAYIVFNRPQHTEQTFAVLREQRPARLFIIAEGPRPEHPTDAERCSAVRANVEQVDWPCEVHRNCAETNLGLERGVSSGLDWVFGQVERAIVLEDDCVAHLDYCRIGEFTMIELGRTIRDLTASRSELVRRPLPPDGPRQRQLDSAAAGETVGWEPVVTLQGGLNPTITYFDRRLRRHSC